MPCSCTSRPWRYAPTCLLYTSAINTGNYLANFVSARTNGFSQDNSEVVQDMRYHQVSFFINDQWKASRRLTLTGGLRFEHMGNWVPNDNYGVAVWDPATYNNTSSAGAWTGLQWHSINSSIPLTGFPSKTLFIAVSYTHLDVYKRQE